MDGMPKIALEDLVIETTRRCNMRCEHCLRGEPENTDMPAQYIRNILSRVASVDVMTFSGGEPALGTAAMREALACCKESRIPVREVYVSTNGKSVAEDFIDILRQWDLYCKQSYLEDAGMDLSGLAGGTDAYRIVRSLSENDAPVGLRLDLSMDRFHDDIPIGNILALSAMPGGLGTGHYSPENDDAWLIRTGMAEWNGMGSEQSITGRPWAYGPDARSPRIERGADGSLSAPLLYVACDGSICAYCDYDYRDMPEYAIGSAASRSWLEGMAVKE